MVAFGIAAKLGKNTLSQAARRSVRNLTVDGKHLGYSRSRKYGKALRNGVLTDSGYIALQFSNPGAAGEAVPLAQAATGNISFDLQEQQGKGKKLSKKSKGKEQLSGLSRASGSKKEGVGALSSTKGNVKVAGRETSYKVKFGTVIAHVSINFCSEADLVCRGIVVPGEVPFAPATPAPTPVTPSSAPTPDISSINVTALKAALDKRGAKYGDKHKKAVLVKLLHAKLEEEEASTSEAPESATPKSGNRERSEPNVKREKTKKIKSSEEIVDLT